MSEQVPDFVQKAIKVSSDMWDKGWIEANGGNISLRLTNEDVDEIRPLKSTDDWISMEMVLGELAEDMVLVSGTGRYLRNIMLDPLVNVGVIEIDQAGGSYRIIYGFESDTRPTSELESHLRTQAAIKRVSNGLKRAVIHTHAPNLVTLSYALDLDTARLSKLLWQMHVECAPHFPEGIEFVPWIMSGCPEVGIATAAALEKRPMALWQFHGVFSRGRNLDEAFGLVDMAEKAAGIYLKAAAAGGVVSKLSVEQIRATNEHFDIPLDEECLNADTEPYFQR